MGGDGDELPVASAKALSAAPTEEELLQVVKQ
jgi:hypothetical protein